MIMGNISQEYFPTTIEKSIAFLLSKSENI